MKSATRASGPTRRIAGIYHAGTVAMIEML
jgi:hypothetical protein